MILNPDASLNPVAWGAQVKALVRQREGASGEAIPPAVEVVVGDIGDVEACRRAVEGVDKVRPPAEPTPAHGEALLCPSTAKRRFACIFSVGSPGNGRTRQLQRCIRSPESHLSNK